MKQGIPIYSLAKDLGVDSKRIILACKALEIYAKASTKRLNNNEYKKLKNYFESGKNVSQETIDISKNAPHKNKRSSNIKENKIPSFPNRLIG